MNLRPTDTPGFADRWGIILSGGDGTRLRDWVYRRRADYLPKQYLNFIGKRSMLEHTWHRAQKLLPAQQLLTVVAKEHLQFDEARRQIASRPSQGVILQPENKDTTPGLLLPLLHLYKRCPKAKVAVFPSDHFVLEEGLFMRHVEDAFRVVESDASRMVLLGLEPHGPDPEYGYIVPGEGVEAAPPNLARQVEMFVEKPCTDAAKKIIASGALWNTMVMVFACKTLLSVVQSVARGLYHSFAPILDALGTADEHAAVERVYQNLPPHNFSKGVLEVLPFEHRQALVVLPVRGVTWSDWGTADHLSGTLRQLGASESVQSTGVLRDTQEVRRAVRNVTGRNAQPNWLAALKGS